VKNWCGTVGPVLVNTTIAFNPAILSTINMYSCRTTRQHLPAVYGVSTSYEGN
jgi:hypothetical protein